MARSVDDAPNTKRPPARAQERELGEDIRLSSMPQVRPPVYERRDYELEITDNLEDLLEVLPPHVLEGIAALAGENRARGMVEIVLDLGRRPEARLSEGEVVLSETEIDREDLVYVAERIGRFGDDNRAGIERTLHRISAIRNRAGDVVGLTCRIGRAVYGTIAILRDLIESGESILLLGRPGVGKTTMLRETARVLADELGKRVIIVDTSNEIAGDGDIPHPAIGRSRRMQVPTPTAQHGVMIEAVENHMPEVVVIDEIGTELEALAARTIAERGVQLIGTAHGNTLENLMLNPTLSDLIGGIQSVTLSDEEARRRGTQKSILERKAPPTFSVMVELISRDEVAVHKDVAATVDAILRGYTPRTELRRRSDDGEITISAANPVRPGRQGQVPGRDSRGEARRTVVDISTRQPPRSQELVEPAPTPTSVSDELGEEGWEASGDDGHVQTAPALPRGRGIEGKPLRIYPFGVSRNRLEQAITTLAVPAVVVRDQRAADLVMTLKNYFRRKPQPLREAETRGMPVYVLRANTGTQMENVLGSLFPDAARRLAERPRAVETALPERQDEPGLRAGDPMLRAMAEVEDAITAVLDGGPAVALTPQAPHIRRLQHELAERFNVASRSRGREPQRRVEVFRPGVQ
ncbi:MAG TPA: R3H domain-containing nucleic acid-binding protein [Thermomicrobiales bacterium]|nr:R3H domain-containing nucleic acid-binding protein [Thermomicrobiales bacterium]